MTEFWNWSYEISGFFRHSDFTWNQFLVILNTQSCILNHFSSSTFWNFGTFWHFQVWNFSKNQHSKPLRLLKWQFLTIWNQSKLISRKIRWSRNLISLHLFQVVVQELRKWAINDKHRWGPRMNYLVLAENLEVVDLGSQSKGKLDFSNQIKFPKTSQFFCQINFFTKKVTNAHCGNYGNLLSLKKISSNHLFSSFFSKTVTFTKFLPKMRESEFP